MNLSHYDLYSILNFTRISELSRHKEYDIFISSISNESMVHDVFNSVTSKEKIWCLLPDYKSSINTADITEYFHIEDLDITSCTIEQDYINKFITNISIETYRKRKICIDITGFVKPYMIYLIYSLKELGFKEIDIIYSEPKYWKNLDKTTFSEESIISTRPINGFETRVESGTKDLHIIAAGYDHKLIRAVASHTKTVQNKQVLIGFPSLQASMYQENILNFQKSADELGITDDEFNPIYAPANDPFETAKTLKTHVDNYLGNNEDVKAIYLSPLSTKPHALGMLLFFLYEKDFYNSRGVDIIMLYPFTRSYSPSAGKKLARINLYSIEFSTEFPE